MPKLLVACDGCGADLERWPSAIRERNYCRQSCRAIGRRRTCARDGCDQVFIPRKCDADAGRGLYCSVKCAAPATQDRRKNGELVACPGCGSGRYYSASRLKRGSRYCSAECFHLSTRKGPEPEPRKCQTCNESFTPRFPAFADRRFCSRRCWGKHRWLSNEAIENLVSSMRQRGLLSGTPWQRWSGRWAGQRFGHLGGRPTVTLTPAQLDQVETLRARGWGRRAIAGKLMVSERAVRNALDS